MTKFVLAVVALCLAPVTQAGTLSVRVERPDWYKTLNQISAWNVVLSGEIDAGAPARVAQALKQVGNDGADVYLNSPGGNLLAGMQLGRVLRDAGVSTHVGNLVPDNENKFAGKAGAKPVPGGCYSACSAGDALSAYADALNAVEAYGVQYDLPSSVSVQVLAQSQLTGTASSTLPNGNAINLGQWQGGVFNPAAPYTLGQLEATGAPPPYAQMHQFMVWEYVNADCNSGNSAPYYARFPLQAGQPDLFTSGQCPTYKNYVNTIDGKVGTNNRSHVLVTSPGYVPQTVPVVGAGS